MTLKISIPDQLKTDEFRFIELRGKTKIPKEPDFTKAAHYAYDDPSLLRHLEKGNNYGILGGQGGFIEIDADHEPLITELKNKLPRTFTVKTPHGGFHKYLKTDDPHTGALLDTIEDIHGDRANLGHVTGYGRQVVGPGCSIKENGGELFYTIEDETPIAEIKWSELNKILGAFLVTKNQDRENDDQEKTEYIFTNDKYQNIMDVVANPDDFIDEGNGQYRGFPIFSGHKKTDYFMIYAKSNNWYSFKDEVGGHIPQLIALQEEIITIGESLKGEGYWKAVKIMEEKYGIKIKHEEKGEDNTLNEKEKLRDTNSYIIFREKRDGTEEFVGIRHKLFADDLITLHHFKTLQDTEEIIHYEDGYYHYEGEAAVRAECERVFGEYINTYHVNEIMNHIRRSTYIKREELNKDLWTLNLENGLFNIKTFAFAPHIPDMLTTIRMPLKYNPDATCPAIEKFISEVVYPEHVTLIKEMIGYCLYHDYTYQNWFLLHGEGANGKSKLLSLIGKFLGEENVSSIGLQDLTQRFAPVNLYGKSANVVADLSDADLKRTARLKQLTGGDLITAEPKFKNAFTYFNFAKLIYSCNKVPLTEDKSKAFFRRVIFIPFPNTFVIGKNADEKILDKLTTEEELSGLLNVAIDGLKHIAGNGGFSGYLTPEENEDLYERASNPVYGFFYDCCEVDVEKYVVKMELYDAFCEYCREMRIVAFSEKKFVQEIKLLVRLEESRISVDKKRLRVWKGITIKDVHHCDFNGGREITMENESLTEITDKNDNSKKASTMSTFLPLLSDNKETNNSIYVLGKKNHGHIGHIKENDDYATCEQCGKKGFLTEHNKICVCSDCLENSKEEQKIASTFDPNGGPNGGHLGENDENPTPFVNISDLDKNGNVNVNVNVNVHKKDDKKFQAKQSREARERLKKEGLS